MSVGESGASEGDRTTTGSVSRSGPSRTEAREFRERVRNEPGRKQGYRPDIRRLLRILLGRDDGDEGR